jgi:hypothetical protein
MKLKKYIKYYETGEIRYIGLIDEKNNLQGEYIEYDKDGTICAKGFAKDNWWIGKHFIYNTYYFNSFIANNIEIPEQEYRKELAMVRLGLIEVPELSYFLKDYDENGKIK